MEKVKIGFILPGPRREIVGGYKMVYQYADYLSTENFDIEILYPLHPIIIKSRFKSFLGFIKKNIIKHTKFYKWYDFKNRLKHTVANDFDAIKLNSYDVLIVTSIETYFYLKEKEIKKDIKKIYFIQDYENWNFSDEIVNKTYLDMEYSNVVISTSLIDKINNVGGEVDLFLPNGIDNKMFFYAKEFHKRKRKSFLFMYHPNKRKGCDMLLKAISNLNDAEIEFSCFSTYKKPNDFPGKIKYHFKPNKSLLSKLYNDNMFFICSSRYEGFGLTPAEAAISGCVVLTTDNGGVSTFIEHKRTGLFFDDINYSSMISLINNVIDESAYESLVSISKNAKDNVKDKLSLSELNIKMKEFILEDKNG